MHSAHIDSVSISQNTHSVRFSIARMLRKLEKQHVTHSMPVCIHMTRITIRAIITTMKRQIRATCVHVCIVANVLFGISFFKSQTTYKIFIISPKLKRHSLQLAPSPIRTYPFSTGDMRADCIDSFTIRVSSRTCSSLQLTSRFQVVNRIVVATSCQKHTNITICFFFSVATTCWMRPTKLQQNTLYAKGSKMNKLSCGLNFFKTYKSFLFIRCNQRYQAAVKATDRKRFFYEHILLYSRRKRKKD